MKIAVILSAMSRASTKAAGRSSKSTAGARKKTAKSARKSVKKASASASRRSAGKPTRPRAAAVARKGASRTSTKPAAAKPTPTPKTVVGASLALVAAEAMMIRTASPPVQPVAPDVPVFPHKYRVGEIVYYTSPSFGRAAATGSYTVIKLLPSDGDDYQYRIKSSGEAFERVAKESQLDRA
jgi:hypothetical protein